MARAASPRIVIPSHARVYAGGDAAGLVGRTESVLGAAVLAKL
jgi:hypothetical protein